MRRELVQAVSVAAAFALLLGAGFVHGRWTDRWTVNTALGDAVARLEGMPATIGDWQGTAQEFDPRMLKAAGVASGLLRSFRNARTGQSVSLLLVCGRPGPVSVHTPDICYPGAGYDLTAPPARARTLYGTPERTADFFSAIFRKPDPVLPEPLVIDWTWSAGDGWSAPDNPRLRFAGADVLYKLYVIRTLIAPVPATSDDDPSRDFLQVLLPALAKEVLVVPTHPSARSRRPRVPSPSSGSLPPTGGTPIPVTAFRSLPTWAAPGVSDAPFRAHVAGRARPSLATPTTHGNARREDHAQST